jgi:glutamate dehydrogenase/leucine dehydrogenase
MKVKKEKGTVTAYPGAALLPPQALFEAKCDVLIPGARPNVITEKNMGAIKARVLVEAANIPMTPAVELAIASRGVTVIPDFVANAGGVISSYVEFIEGTEQDMFTLVRDKITTNTLMVLERTKNGDTRKAALGIARERVLDAMEKRGTKKR